METSSIITSVAAYLFRINRKISKNLGIALLCLFVAGACTKEFDEVPETLDPIVEPFAEEPVSIFDPIDLTIFSYETEITDPEMLNAIEYALSIWENYIDSEVTIKVNIKIVPNLQELGQGIPNLAKEFEGAPVSGVWYPTSLANHISGKRLNGDEFDMDIWLNPRENWSYETEGEIPDDQLDFVALFMHEVCHGLGFVSSALVEDNLGSFGRVDQSDFIESLSFPLPDLQGQPLIFSTLLTFGQNTFSLMNQSKYPNNSEALHHAFVSDHIFLNTPPRTFNDVIRPKIFAKYPFKFGSSLSHLDEKTYPEGGGNALMTPFIEVGGRAEREPGTIVLGLLKEIGWSVV